MPRPDGPFVVLFPNERGAVYFRGDMGMTQSLTEATRYDEAEARRLASEYSRAVVRPFVMMAAVDDRGVR